MLVSLILTAGGTVYYYFTSSIICLLVAHAIKDLGIKWLTLGLVACVAGLEALPFVTMATGLTFVSAYYSPLNFLSYPFLAVLLSKNLSRAQIHTTGVLIGAVGCAAVLAIFEWKTMVNGVFFQGQHHAFPTYTRASLVFTVVALGVIAINPRIRSTALVNFMSGSSLALYCLHPYFIGPVERMMNSHGQVGFIGYGISIMMVILLCYAAKYFLKWFIRPNLLE